MPRCLICNKELGMITESHMQKNHNLSCNEYAHKFNFTKGQLNQHHSQKMKGSGNSRFGAIISPETKEKIRTRHIQSGRFAGAGNPMFGKTHSPEVRRKISELHRGKFIGERNPFFGQKHSPETKQKISSIRITKGLAKGENNPLFGRGHSTETKQKLSLLKKEFFRNHPEKHINFIITKNYKNQNNKKGGYISRKQVEIYELLLNDFPDAKLNHPVKAEGNLYFADVGIPSIKVDLEYDSSYWHKNILKDSKRDEKLRLAGWAVIRIRDRQIDRLGRDELHTFILNTIKQTTKP